MKRILLLVVLVMVIVGGLKSQNNSPLCFTARNGSVTVRFDIKNVTHTIQYSTDGLNWNNYIPNSNVTINVDRSVYFRAETSQDSAAAFSNGFNNSGFHFSSSNGGTVEGSGNIMSLYGPNCPDLQLQPWAFASLFYDCSLLTTSPILPSTLLAERCYEGMFYGCISLSNPPILSAMKLAKGCYKSMFGGCTSMTIAPSLPATQLEEECYSNMFEDCTSLVTPPSLPADTLADYCYNAMLWGCTSLINPPSLPALVLAKNCYQNLFGKCTSLVTPPSLPATSMKEWCYSDMFYQCLSLVTSPSLPADTLADYCYSSMFSGCTTLVAAPSLPATKLAKKCYDGMFMYCFSLTNLPVLPADTLVLGCYDNMFGYCTSLVLNTEAPGKEWSIDAYTTNEAATMGDMFAGTAGTMNGTPSVKTTYYIVPGGTDIEEVNDNPSYVVYSNHGRIYVDGALGGSIRVYDVNGGLIDEVLRASEEQELVVDVEGVYFVRIDDNETVKVVVR